MELAQATEIAERIKTELAPFCERIEIAGSIRRRKPEVKDIEIVCIPKTVPFEADLFQETRVRLFNFIQTLRDLGCIRKGCLRTGKYIQLWVLPGIQLDLFTANFDNWGLIFAIRTGNAAFSHKVLATGWVRAGYHSVNGHLVKGCQEIPVREERDLFDLIGLPWREPWERNL